MRRRIAAALIVVLGLVLAGCASKRQARRECPTPATLGINSRDLIDPVAQAEYETLTTFDDFALRADYLRLQAYEQGLKDRNPKAPPFRAKNVLALSGGGSFGAFSAGVVCGWTAHGDRPEFDVVTGISTGALIAPFAFLGPAYDDNLRAFYTTLEEKDLYQKKPIRGLFGEALMDNARIAGHVDRFLTPQVIADLAQAHAKGRRLYIGTTAVESKRFIIWDIGEMAARGRPCDRLLIKQVMLGSAAIPGAFAPQHITVDVDGTCVTERHADGGISTAVFIHPPYVSPEHRSKSANADLAGTNLYLVVAGKLYADLEPVKPLALEMAGKEISAMIYAQTRGDLQRIYLTSALTGMNYHLAAIPPEYPAPTSSMSFNIPALTGMFNEGFRLANSGSTWRRTPPGVGPGENGNLRAGTSLSHRVRGPVSVSEKSKPPLWSYPMTDTGIPALPLEK